VKKDGANSEELDVVEYSGFPVRGVGFVAVGADARSCVYSNGGSRGPIAVQEGEYALEQNLSNDCSRPTSRGSVWERLQCFPRLQAFRQKKRMQNGLPW
jgi:hypothetical protein